MRSTCVRARRESNCAAAVSRWLKLGPGPVPAHLRLCGGRAPRVFVISSVGAAAVNAIFAAVALTSRIVSLSSMVAALAAPVPLWVFSSPPAVVGLSVLIASMIIVRHRGNLRRLLAGTEPRFGSISSR